MKFLKKLLLLNGVVGLLVTCNVATLYYLGIAWGIFFMVLAIIGFIILATQDHKGWLEDLDMSFALIFIFTYPVVALTGYEYVYYRQGEVVPANVSFEEVYANPNKYAFFKAEDFQIEPKITGYFSKHYKAKRSNDHDRTYHYYVTHLANNYGWGKHRVWLTSGDQLAFRKQHKKKYLFYIREHFSEDGYLQAVERASRKKTPQKVILVTGTTNDVTYNRQRFKQWLINEAIVVNILWLLLFVFGDEKPEKEEV